MDEKFNPSRLGDTYKDKNGRKWKLKSICMRPTIILETENGEELVVSVDSGIAQGLEWYRRAEASQ